MIDFRYHIVSLISVFLALAVGIALGAGPLKETIGETLTGQVEQLRGEKDALRTELDAVSRELADTTSFVDASGPQLLSDTLTGRRIAVVALGEVSDEVRDAVDTRLGQSGATVTAHVTLTESWTDPDLRSFRQALAGNLLAYLDTVPTKEAAVEDQLAAALVEGLVGADPVAPNTLTTDASYLLDLLTGGDVPLVTLQDPVVVPADAVVVLAPPLPAQDEASPNPADTDAALVAELAVVSAAQELSEGAVLAGGPRGEGSLVDAVLADEALAGTISTVSGTELVPGQVSVPLALASRIGGVVGHYGFGDGETVIPEPVVLPPVDRTAVPAGAGVPEGQG